MFKKNSRNLRRHQRVSRLCDCLAYLGKGSGKGTGAGGSAGGIGSGFGGGIGDGGKGTGGGGGTGDGGSGSGRGEGTGGLAGSAAEATDRPRPRHTREMKERILVVAPSFRWMSRVYSACSVTLCKIDEENIKAILDPSPFLKGIVVALHKMLLLNHPFTERSDWISVRTGSALAKSKCPRAADRSSRASALCAYSFRATSSDFCAAFHD
jgi:hypothetical protein